MCDARLSKLFEIKTTEFPVVRFVYRVRECALTLQQNAAIRLFVEPIVVDEALPSINAF